jgi:hypothetical protein
LNGPTATPPTAHHLAKSRHSRIGPLIKKVGPNADECCVEVGNDHTDEPTSPTEESVSDPTKQPLSRKYLACLLVAFCASLLSQILWPHSNSVYDEGVFEIRWTPWVLFAGGSIWLLSAPAWERRWSGWIDESQAQSCCRVGVYGFAIFWYAAGWPVLGIPSGFLISVGLVAAYWAFRWSPGPPQHLIRLP